MGIGRATNRIRAIRQERGMTLAMLAGQVDISIAFLSDIEKGHRRGSRATLARIADALGVDVNDLQEAG